MRLVRRSGFVGVVAAVALLVGAMPAHAAPGDGSAYAADVDLTLAKAPTIRVGPLAPSSTEGRTSAELASLAVPGVVSAGVVTSAVGRDESTGIVRAKATLDNVELTMADMGNIGWIEAGCESTTDGNNGWTTLGDVRLADAVVASNPAPNTTMRIPSGPVPSPLVTVVFNEQIRNDDGSLTVNAMHIKPNVMLGEGEVILGRAQCGVPCPPVPLASGAGLWLGLGVVGLAAIAVGFVVVRRRLNPMTG
ncbi:MAG: choice-of-anchor P family protein [Actinomycetota bacterium]|nr:choice-of-anchor P family protein [Actinomycetota bacterium]